MPELDLQITVYGQPESAGSKTADPVMRTLTDGRRVPVTDRHGRPVLRMRDSNKRSYGWKDTVAQEAALARGRRELLTGAVAVEFTFYRPRNRGDWGSGRNAHLVKDSAPAAPIVAPDVLKLARAVEDALTGIVYRDDAQIVQETLRKRYGEPARVEILVWVLDDQTAADLPLAERTREVPGQPADKPAGEQGVLALA